MLSQELLDQIADAIAQRVVDKLRAGDFGTMLDQTASPLGPRRHAKLARELIAHGDSRACRVGRRWLVERAAIEENLTKAPAPDNEVLVSLGLEKSA